jgi:hypothetical protein
MKAERFGATPEFEHFKNVMRGVLAVPKERMEELLKEARDESPRKGDPNAPGRKRVNARPAKKR